MQPVLIALSLDLLLVVFVLLPKSVLTVSFTKWNAQMVTYRKLKVWRCACHAQLATTATFQKITSRPFFASHNRFVNLQKDDSPFAQLELSWTVELSTAKLVQKVTTAELELCKTSVQLVTFVERVALQRHPLQLAISVRLDITVLKELWFQSCVPTSLNQLSQLLDRQLIVHRVSLATSVLMVVAMQPLVLQATTAHRKHVTFSRLNNMRAPPAPGILGPNRCTKPTV